MSHLEKVGQVLAGIHNLTVAFSAGHKKIILYANPGKEGFYHKLGFRKMNTAMAIFSNQAQAGCAAGLARSTAGRRWRAQPRRHCCR